ncbi:MAG: 50S ribosomal protein L17 [Planctomycetes bacterium]|nr:50S ribosomal protein L17 [Planctomycetota bacterium]
MRHQIRGRKLSRTSAHKTALRRNLLSSLFTYERIITTVAKAKEFRPMAERYISLAREKNLHNIRLALAAFPGRAGRAVVMKLFNDIGPRANDSARKGGYTRILKLGKARLGDNAPRAIFELVDRKVEAAPVAETETEAKTEDAAAAPKKTRKKAAAKS